MCVYVCVCIWFIYTISIIIIYVSLDRLASACLGKKGKKMTQFLSKKMK